MMEVMGLHIPGAAFVNPGTKLRQELTRAAVHRLAEIGWDGNDYLDGGNGADQLNGQAGTDTCVVGPGGLSTTGCE